MRARPGVKILLALVVAASLVGVVRVFTASAQGDPSRSGTMSSIALSTTVGVDAAVCAATDALEVGPGTAVTTCYEVRNTGLTTLTRHDLVDSHLGVILDDFVYTLMPGATVFLTQTTVITESRVNTATWTAYNPGPADVSVAEASASGTVVLPSIALRTYLPLVAKLP